MEQQTQIGTRIGPYLCSRNQQGHSNSDPRTTVRKEPSRNTVQRSPPRTSKRIESFYLKPEAVTETRTEVEIVNEHGASKAQIEILETAMKHTFALFVEDLQDIGSLAKLARSNVPVVLSPTEMDVDATFLIETAGEEWERISDLIGPKGSRRPYVRQFKLIHYYPYQTLHEVKGYRISVSPLTQKFGVAITSRLSMCFRIMRTVTLGDFIKVKREPKWI